MSERIRDNNDDALYKSTCTLLYFTGSYQLLLLHWRQAVPDHVGNEIELVDAWRGKRNEPVVQRTTPSELRVDLAAADTWRRIAKPRRQDRRSWSSASPKSK